MSRLTDETDFTPNRDPRTLVSHQELNESINRIAANWNGSGQLSSSCLVALDEGLSLLVNGLGDDLELWDNGTSFEELYVLPQVLPAVFSEYYTPELLARLQKEIPSVLQKIKTCPDNTPLASTAQELLAHAILEHAEQFLDLTERHIQDPDAQVAVIADDEIAEVRTELSDLLEQVFEDYDVLNLFAPDLDVYPANQQSTYLHVDEWFKPFNGA